MKCERTATSKQHKGVSAMAMMAGLIKPYETHEIGPTKLSVCRAKAAHCHGTLPGRQVQCPGGVLGDLARFWGERSRGDVPPRTRHGRPPSFGLLQDGWIVHRRLHNDDGQEQRRAKKDHCTALPEGIFDLVRRPPVQPVVVGRACELGERPGRHRPHRHQQLLLLPQGRKTLGQAARAKRSSPKATEEERSIFEDQHLHSYLRSSLRPTTPPRCCPNISKPETAKKRS